MDNSRVQEFEQKQERIRSLLAERQLDALLLRRVGSFAWATCGAASYVNTATTDGASSLLIMPQGRYVLTNTIEAPRLQKEEEPLGEQGWQWRINPWYKTDASVAELTRGLKLGADGPFPGAVDVARELSRMRAALMPQEDDRFRRLGRLCAEAMDNAARAVRPGMTEYEIAALMSHETQGRGAQPTVVLVATDTRVFQFRHPLPTDRKLERYAMLVLCGRKWGLVCSITRLVHFGRIPEEVRRKAEATARVDATMIDQTRPGKSIGEIFARATRVYAESGFADEWQLHHQGGPAGYEPREFLATPESTDVVATGQAYAWNPSITGTKSEDTILVGTTENEVITSIPSWPMLNVPLAGGRTMTRPAILEVE